VKISGVQLGWRSLFHDLKNYRGGAVEPDLLLPWLEQGAATEVVTALRRFGEPEAAGWRLQRDRSSEDDQLRGELYELYALSRVADVLIAPYQAAYERPEIAEDRWSGEQLPPLEAYETFCRALGMTRIEHGPFHPFFHEIVVVDPDDNKDAQPTIVEELWPGFLMGSLLFSRPGVRVRAGAVALEKSVAETSTLFFAWWRRNRPTDDLSHGWGHNSQWRTEFRRDYLIDGTAYFNVDGELDVHEPKMDRDAHFDDDGELVLHDPKQSYPKFVEPLRKELLRHRCWVHVDHGADDAWPYDYRYEEQIG
jgi:hypothetical protein